MEHYFWMLGWILFYVYLYPHPLVLIIKCCTIIAYLNMILYHCTSLMYLRYESNTKFN